MTGIRTFIGIGLPRTSRQWLARCLQQHPGRGLRRIAEENYHLTLAFLGDRSETQTALAAHGLRTLPLAGPIALQVATIGPFPRSPGRILAALFEPSTALMHLQEDIMAMLRDLEIEVDDRPYTPHVTLAKCRRPRPISTMDVDRSAPESRVTITAVTLYKSELTPEGSHYTALAHFPLAGG